MRVAQLCLSRASIITLATLGASELEVVSAIKLILDASDDAALLLRIRYA
jgi:hypothetical protein